MDRRLLLVSAAFLVAWAAVVPTADARLLDLEGEVSLDLAPDGDTGSDAVPSDGQEEVVKEPPLGLQGLLVAQAGSGEGETTLLSAELLQTDTTLPSNGVDADATLSDGSEPLVETKVRFGDSETRVRILHGEDEPAHTPDPHPEPAPPDPGATPAPDPKPAPKPPQEPEGDATTPSGSADRAPARDDPADRDGPAGPLVPLEPPAPRAPSSDASPDAPTPSDGGSTHGAQPGGRFTDTGSEPPEAPPPGSEPPREGPQDPRPVNEQDPSEEPGTPPEQEGAGEERRDTTLGEMVAMAGLIGAAGILALAVAAGRP